MHLLKHTGIQPFILRAVDVKPDLVTALVSSKDNKSIDHDRNTLCVYEAGGTERVTLTGSCQPFNMQR